MAKKKVDLWSGVNTNSYKTPEATQDSASNFLNKNSKKSKGADKEAKKHSGLTPGDGHDPHLDERKIKNPLHVIEGQETHEANVSTAVSAALAKAIQDDYEISKLSEILDVVIDEVDDPDLSNESLRRKNFGIIPVFLIIGSIVLAIILIPLVLMLGYSINKVSSVVTAREQLGYRTDLEETPTNFAIEHIDTGQYIVPPTTVNDINAPVTLTSVPYTADWSLQEMFFHIEDNKYGETFQVSFDSPVKSGETMSIINDGGEIRWMNSFEAQSGIYLIKNKSGEQEFSIGFDNTSKFVSVDEDTNQLTLSNQPDYFKFIAKVDPIITGEDYINDYIYLNQGSSDYISSLDIGYKGNPVALYSNKSKQYLAGYKNVNYSQIPFIDISGHPEYWVNNEEFFTLSSRPSYDFFVSPVEAYNADTSITEEYLTLGSFQTTEFDWSQIPLVSADDAENSLVPQDKPETKYPILTATSSGPQFKQYQHAYKEDKGTLDDGTIINSPLEIYENTKLMLIPDPTNLHRKAIYFTESETFLTTEGGKVGLQQIDDLSQYEELDFFTFVHSKNRNPEGVRSKVDSLTTNSGAFTIYSSNYSNLEGFELKLLGYERNHFFELMGYAGDIINSSFIEDKGEAIKAIFRASTDDEFYLKGLTTRVSEPIYLTDLEFNTWYIGYANIFRDEDRFVGKHTTSIPVIFKTADSAGNINNWGDGQPITLDLPDGGNPTDPSTADTVGVIDTIVDSSSYENTTSINYQPGGDVSTMDIKADEMRDLASTAIDVTFNLTNGEISNSESGVITGVTVKLYEYTGNPSSPLGDIAGEQQILASNMIDGLEDGEYTLLFRDLDPETEYVADISVRDINNDWFPLFDQTDIWSQVFETERAVPSELSSSLDLKYTMGGYGVSYEMSKFETSKLKTTDQLRFVFTADDGTKLDTGFRQYSDYKSGVNTNPSGIYIEIGELLVGDGIYISVGGPSGDPSSIIGREYTFEAQLKVTDSFDNWDKNSPIWDDVDGALKTFNIFSGTLKQEEK